MSWLVALSGHQVAIITNMDELQQSGISDYMSG